MFFHSHEGITHFYPLRPAMPNNGLDMFSHVQLADDCANNSHVQTNNWG